MELAAYRARVPGAGAVAARRAGGLSALAATLVAAIALGAGAAGQRALFAVPASKHGFPGWLRGPLAHAGLRLDSHGAAAFVAVLFAAYLVLVACASAVPKRVVVAAIVVLHGIFLLAPPLFSADVFSYVDYARLGLVHGLDPYANGAAAAPRDPVIAFVRWHDVPSAYGPVFTIGGYALAHLSVPVTFWVYKAAAALAGLGCVAMVWHLAARTGRDERSAAAFVAFNPLFVAYAVGGAHNDLLLELLVLAAIASVLRSRERTAGAQIALAALVKASAGLLLPFLVIGARHRGRVVVGVVAATGSVWIAALVALGRHPFGFVPQLLAQQRMVAHDSVPNELALLLGRDGLPTTLRTACLVAFGLAISWLLWRAWRGADWIACAGWATLAGLVTSAWLVPWYAVWLLPLAALAPSRALRASTLVFCAYVVATHVIPELRLAA